MRPSSQNIKFWRVLNSYLNQALGIADHDLIIEWALQRIKFWQASYNPAIALSRKEEGIFGNGGEKPADDVEGAGSETRVPIKERETIKASEE